MSRIYTRASLRVPAKVFNIGEERAHNFLDGWIDGVARHIAARGIVDIYGLGVFTYAKVRHVYGINPLTGRRVIVSYDIEPQFNFSPEFAAKFASYKTP